ncbi:MAG TPA: type II toxin-antitoxin system VapC family toxin [Caulobacteraceae bacterium]|nr:type II toxin-antitoxin system VapC family toxin [Caulobacteraceae bacterium]
MRLYLDTSLLVAVLTNEPRTEAVASWMDDHRGAEFVSSLWMEAELSAALSMKVRSKALDEDGRRGALALFRRVRTRSLSVLSVADEHFRSAALLADRPETGLRAGDALHMAIASSHGARICTLDRRLAAAGPPLGVQTELV